MTLEPVDGNDPQLRSALHAAALALDDIADGNRMFFALRDDAGAPAGFSGLEICGRDVLLRSMVVLPDRRGLGLGRVLTEMTVAKAAPDADVYLATTTATAFFASLGFSTVSRTCVPAAVLSTRQLSGLCPASATIMKRNRPPT